VFEATIFYSDHAPHDKSGVRDGQGSRELTPATGRRTERGIAIY